MEVNLSLDRIKWRLLGANAPFAPIDVDFEPERFKRQMHHTLEGVEGEKRKC